MLYVRKRVLHASKPRVPTKQSATAMSRLRQAHACHNRVHVLVAVLLGFHRYLTLCSVDGHQDIRFTGIGSDIFIAYLLRLSANEPTVGI